MTLWEVFGGPLVSLHRSIRSSNELPEGFLPDTFVVEFRRQEEDTKEWCGRFAAMVESGRPDGSQWKRDRDHIEKNMKIRYASTYSFQRNASLTQDERFEGIQRLH
jgi:hypothetical protein